jgi:hypothetical protein
LVADEDLALLVEHPDAILERVHDPLPVDVREDEPIRTPSHSSLIDRNPRGLYRSTLRLSTSIGE